MPTVYTVYIVYTVYTVYTDTRTGTVYTDTLCTQTHAHNRSLPQSKKWRRQVGEEASESAPPKSRRRQPHDEVGIARTKRFVFLIFLYLRFLQRAHNRSLPQSKKWRRQVREEASESAPPKSRRRQPHEEVGIARTRRFVFQKKKKTRLSTCRCESHLSDVVFS
jgi:transposase-like protein